MAKGTGEMWYIGVGWGVWMQGVGVGWGVWMQGGGRGAGGVCAIWHDPACARHD